MKVRWPLAAALGIVGAWGGACASLYLRAFAPAQGRRRADRAWTPADLGVPHEGLEVRTEDGLRLLAWFFPGHLPAAVVVSGGHRGWASDVLGISTALWRAGFGVAVFGWRGTPGSDPAPHTLGVHERRDLEATIAAVRRRVGATTPLGLLGYSMGGAVSLVVAAADPTIAAVCVDSAFSDPVAVLSDGVRRSLRLPPRLVVAPVAALAGKLRGARLDELRPLDAVARLRGRPLLVVHGIDDRSVPVHHAYRLLEAAGPGAESWLVPGVDHVGAYFADREGYVARVVRFFSDALGVTQQKFCFDGTAS